MRITVYAGTLRAPGSTYVGSRIIGELSKRDDVTLRSWHPAAWQTAFSGGNVSARETAGGPIDKAINEGLLLRADLAQWRPDALLSLTDTGMPFARVPHALLVQLCFLAYPSSDWDFSLPRALRAKLAAIQAYFAVGKRSVRAFVVQTDHMRARLAARWNLAADRIHVIPSAIDDPVVQPIPVPERPTLIYPATALAHKNHRILPFVMHEVRKRHADAVCRLTLDPSQLPDMLDDARRLGVLSAFDFVGSSPRETILQMISSASCLLMPSFMESLGLPLLEAMALRTPVIAADRPYAREVCGDAALYADPHSPEDCASRVVELLGSGETHARLAAAGRSRWEQMPSWSEIGMRFVALLERIRG